MFCILKFHRFHYYFVQRLVYVLLVLYQEFLHVTPPSSCSHGWRGILIGRDLIKHHVGWAIGNGEDVGIWTEPWLSTTTWEAPIGPPPLDSLFLTVAWLLLPNGRDWDAGKIEMLLPHLQENTLH